MPAACHPYVLAQCLGKYPHDHLTAFARYENARTERTAAVVRAAAETRKRAFNKTLADAKGAQVYLAQEWHQDPVVARYDKVYAYDATSVAV